MFLQINIVMNNFGSSKFEQDEEIFEKKIENLSEIKLENEEYKMG